MLLFPPHLSVLASGMHSKLLARRPARRQDEPRVPGQHLARGRGCFFHAACLVTFWQQYRLLVHQRANESRGSRPAWVATTETLVKLIVTVLIIGFRDLLHHAPHSRRCSWDDANRAVFALVRGVCGMKPRGLRADSSGLFRRASIGSTSACLLGWTKG
jgi:hypothetical protein